MRFRTVGVRSSTRSTVLRGEAEKIEDAVERIIATTATRATVADATRAVGDVASAVQTAQLALAESQSDHLPHAYLQSVLVDAERISGMAAQTLSSVQPPELERQRSSEAINLILRTT